MRLGYLAVVAKYRNQIQPGARPFNRGDIVIAVDQEGSSSFIFYGMSRDGIPVPWMKDTLYIDEYIPLNQGPAIIDLPPSVFR